MLKLKEKLLKDILFQKRKKTPSFEVKLGVFAEISEIKPPTS